MTGRINRSSLEDWLASRRPAVVGWSVFAVCILIALVIHVSFLRFEQEKERELFVRDIDGQISRLHQAARNIEARFEGIRTLLEFSDEVTRAEFEGAAGRLLKSLPSLDAVEYAPLVQDRDRAALEAKIRAEGYPNFTIRDRNNSVEPATFVVAPTTETYLPIVYRLPPFANSEMFGFNMYTSLRRPALLHSVQTGETLMSHRGQLFDRERGVLGFILYVPVFETLDHESGLTIERGPFRGMIQGVVRLEPFLNAMFTNRSAETRHTVLIEDRGIGAGDTSLGIIDEAGKVNPISAEDRIKFTEPAVLNREIKLWGRNLNLAFRQTPISPFQRLLHRPGEAVSGVLVSTAFGLLAFSLARRNRLVEQEVQLRTRELKAIQLQLEGDIAQRVAAENRLRSSEQRYRSLFDQHPDAVYSSDLNGNFQSANQGMERITGYSLAELVTMSCQSLVTIECKDATKANFVRAASGQSVNFDHVGIGKSGVPFHVNVTQLPIVVDGHIVGVYGIAKDITEMTRVTRELENFFDLSAEMMSISGVDGFCRRVNRAFEKVTWFSTREFTSKPFIDFVHPEDQAATLAQVSRLSPELTTVSVENRIRTRSGEYRLFAWSIRLVPGERILHAVAHDVTDRRQKEVQIREQASLLDKAQDAIVVYDLEFRISYWNKSSERLYGWTTNEAVGRDIRDLIYRDHREAFQTAHAALIASGERMGELKQTSRDGRSILGEARWSLVRTEAGNAYSVLSIITDITEQKKVEAQFLRVQRVESLGTLASGIAHDLNNVLAPILMATGLLRHGNRDESELKILNSMEISARRGSDLVKQILAFARGDEGQQIPTSPAHLFQEMATVIAETFPKSLHCDIRTSHDVWPIVCDPTQLHQVLLNLCLNARDAMPRGGTLSLSAENVVLDESHVSFNHEGGVGPHVMLKISDTGTGIPADIRDKVFDPFFTTKEVGKGTGLGLSTVLTIVRTNRGFLRLSSAVGKGTTFRIYFPAEPANLTVKSPVEIYDYPRGSGEVILVVDDEESVRMVTKRTLEAFGYRPIVANNGAEALVKYVEQQHEIAAVLTDMMMPVMDGPALIRALTNLNPNVLVIAASGLHVAGNGSTQTESGVTEFLPKPYTTEVMLETVARVLKMRVERS